MGSRDLLASKPVGKIRVDLSIVNLDTSNWTTLAAAFPSSCSAISVAYTGKGILKLAKGAAASEVELPLYLTPGMNHEMLIPLELAKSVRLSGKCDDQAVTSGELVINLFG
jgi:hypothetical protein